MSSQTGANADQLQFSHSFNLPYSLPGSLFPQTELLRPFHARLDVTPPSPADHLSFLLDPLNLSLGPNIHLHRPSPRLRSLVRLCGIRAKNNRPRHGFRLW